MAQKPPAPLNAKQRRFVTEYQVDYNATQAAIRAGYSKESAYSQGARLLKHAGVKVAIEREARRHRARAELTIDLVLERLENNYNMSTSLQQMAPANKCVELMGRHLGMFAEKHEHEHKVTLSDLLREVADDE